MDQAGRPLLEHGLRRRLEWLRSRWWFYPVTALGLIACLAVPVSLFPHMTIPAIVALGAFMGYVVGDAVHDKDARIRRDEASGEEATARVLRRLEKTGARVAHNVPFEGREIDHAVVGQSGAIVVESLYTHTEWTVTVRGVVETTAHGSHRPIPWPVSGATRSARDLRLLALSHPSRIRTSVVPVVVLWGPKVARIDGGARWVDGVLVAVGAQWREWLDALTGSTLGADEADRVWAAIATRKQEHRSSTVAQMRVAA